MRLQLTFLLAALLPLFGWAQPELMPVRSRSDQFIVYGPSSPRFGTSLVGVAETSEGRLFLLQPRNSLASSTESKVHLEPSLVAVSCERIKDAFLADLSEQDTRHRRIHIQLNSRLRPEQTTIHADRYERGLIYKIEMPVEVNEHFFAATIVQVLLHELACRQILETDVDLPEWLINGYVSYLQSKSPRSFALRPNAHLAQVQMDLNPVVKLRRKFEQELPLSFDELSWPGTLPQERARLFQDSAHLFVHELLKLRSGKESFRRFIYELPHHQNWQFAFLGGFSDHFKQLVDVEKWWGVQFVNFMGRDVTQLWSLEETWKQLKAALDVTVQVHLQTNRMPVTAEYRLQDAILEWDYARQDPVLQKSLNQLRGMRFRSHPDLRPLVDAYRKVLEYYFEQRALVGRSVTRHRQNVPTTANFLKQKVCRQLDALDAELASAREQMLALTAAAAEAADSPE